MSKKSKKKYVEPIVKDSDGNVYVSIETVLDFIEDSNRNYKKALEHIREYIKIISSDYNTLYSQDADLITLKISKIVDKALEDDE